jgi:putative ABC transport system permease protein
MTFLLGIIRLGLQNLRLHKLRSALTSLGIIFGVAAVILMVAIGEGNKQRALRDIEALGATNIILRSQRPPEQSSFGTQERSFIARFGLTRQDLRRLEHYLDDAAYVVPVKSVGDEMSHLDKRLVSQAYGTTPELAEVANLHVNRGRYITHEDLEQRLTVAVIGAEVAKQLFPLQDPIGSDIKIAQRIYRVVGVLKPVGLAGGRGSALVGRDLNKDVHLPITTAEIEFGDIVQRRTAGSFSGEEVEISEIYVATTSSDVVLQTADRIRRVTEVGHPDLSDVQIVVPWELLEKAKRDTLMMNIMLISIAAISLLVGGIGIMNIMLASVTERTREIGIRRALGATRRHIIYQFLVETGTISSVGGFIGIGVGLGLSWFIDKVLPWVLNLPSVTRYFDVTVEYETQVTLWSIVVSFTVASIVGLVFGVYPAIIASRQDPIVALRHD